MSRHLIVADCETGGLDPQYHDLLTVALVDWRNGQIGDTQEWKLRADPARVTPRALAVNGIDLSSHNASAVLPETAAGEIEDWCREHWPLGERVRLAGHNVAFDVGFLRRLIGPTYSESFHHRPVCTMSLLPLLWHAGVIPADVGNLSAACAALGVPIPDGAAHTALGDALATASLYTAMLVRVRVRVRP